MYYDMNYQYGYIHCKPNRNSSQKHSLEIYCGMSAVQQQTNNFQCVYCHCTTATKLMLVLPMEEIIWSAIGFEQKWQSQSRLDVMCII